MAYEVGSIADFISGSSKAVTNTSQKLITVDFIVQQNVEDHCTSQTSNVSGAHEAKNRDQQRSKRKEWIQREEENKRIRANFPVDLEKESRTVFVKNIPHVVKISKLKKAFEQFGEIQALRLRCAAVSDPKVSKRVAVIKKQFHPGRSTISAFVCFTDEDSVERAVAATGMILKDNHLIIDRAVTGGKHSWKNSIFLGNVPFVVEEEDIWKMFEACGNIKDIRIVRDSKTGLGKGFAYVNFESFDAVQLALELDGEKLKDRPLRVSCHLNSQKHQGRNAGNRKQHGQKMQGMEKSRKKKMQPKNTNKKTSSFHGQEVPAGKKVKKKVKLNKAELKRRAIKKKFGFLKPEKEGCGTSKVKSAHKTRSIGKETHTM